MSRPKNSFRIRTAVLTVAGVLCLAAVAAAAPALIAQYSFNSSGEVSSFQKYKGKKCKKNHRGGRSMGVTVGKKTINCGFRAPVVGDSSGGANLQIGGAVSLSVETPKKIQKRTYVGLATRTEGQQTGYEVRIYPLRRMWQVLRDPPGSAPPKSLGKGKGKLIKGVGARNGISLRAFQSGSGVELRAGINGKVVVTRLETGPGIPDGRYAGVTVGSKGNKSARGAVGKFDDISIHVPSS